MTTAAGGERVNLSGLAARVVTPRKAFLDYLRETFPELRVAIKHIFADGDYVIAHVHGVRMPGQRGSAIIDIFKLERGSIVEHWDVIQPIPEDAENPNGMF